MNTEELLRRLAEPDDLRRLRQQKEQIRENQRREAERQAWKDEADRLRRDITRMGHKPVCCVQISN